MPVGTQWPPPAPGSLFPSRWWIRGIHRLCCDALQVDKFSSEAASLFLSGSCFITGSSPQYVFIASLLLLAPRSFAEGKAAETGPATQQLPLESPPLKIHRVCRWTDGQTHCQPPPRGAVARQGAATEQGQQGWACAPSSALLFLQQQLKGIWHLEVCCNLHSSKSQNSLVNKWGTVIITRD